MKKIDYLPHDEVIKCQQQSQVLLLIINETPNSAMILTGKFFEYMAARRPILCLGPEDGDAARILKETQTGLLAGFQDVDRMKKNILHFYRQFKDGNLNVLGRGIEKFSRRELTRELSKVLNEISEKTS